MLKRGYYIESVKKKEIKRTRSFFKINEYKSVKTERKKIKLKLKD